MSELDGVWNVRRRSGALPPLIGCRSVVTIHDCIHLMFPQYLPNRFAFAYAQTSIRLAARRATRIMTVSESSKPICDATRRNWIRLSSARSP